MASSTRSRFQFSKDTVLRAMACSLIRAESLITTGTYVIKPPEPVAAPTFSPAAGTYVHHAVGHHHHRHYRRVHSLHERRQRTDLQPAHAYTGADPSRAVGDAQCHRLQGRATIDSDATSAAYVITPPAAAPLFDPAPGAYTSVQHVTLTSATPAPRSATPPTAPIPPAPRGTTYGDPIAIANSLTLKAVACAAGYSDSPVTSGGYDITLPPPPSRVAQRRHQQSRGDPPIFAGGSTSTNENGDALNISGRGKFESSAQVFRFVYANVTGDFTITARLDGVDFAGLASSQARAGLFLTPDFTPTATNLIYGRTILVGDGTPSAHPPPRVGNSNSNSTITATAPARDISSSRAPAIPISLRISLNGGVTLLRPAPFAPSLLACRSRCTSASPSARATTPPSARPPRSATSHPRRGRQRNHRPR